MYKAQLDETDKKIISIVEEQPGIRLGKLSEAVGICNVSTRSRILILAVMGELELERGRRALFIYPKKIGGAQ